MVFITSHNRYSFLWLRWIIFLVFIFIFFIFGGKSLIIRGTVFFSKIFSFSQRAIFSSDERAALRAKIADLETERDSLYALTQKKDSLKTIIFANIQLGGRYLFADSLIADQGTLDDVAVGDIVTTDEGLLIGSVVERGSHWSKIVPFTQLGKKIVVRGGANKQTIFEINGVGGGEAEVNLPASLDIKVGDVYWSGEHPDYIAGIVDHIDRSPASQIQTISIRPPLAFSLLTHVIIHKNNNEHD